MPIYTTLCKVCGTMTHGRYFHKWPDNPPCPDCLGTLEIVPYVSSMESRPVHPKERAVLWLNPITGERRTPGRNDEPIPPNYASRGFVRHEFEHFRDLESYCHKHGLINEIVEYDQGSGRAEKDLY